MPFLQAGDLSVNYALTGPAAAPVILFSHSLGADLTAWDPQVASLETSFRVLRYDIRGHGRTSVAPGPYTIEQLGKDVVRLLDALGLGSVWFCGLSIGGQIGIWLGAHAPARVSRLALCNTAARIGTVERWNARIEAVLRQGMREVAAAAVERWFTPEFRAGSPEAVAAAFRMVESTPPEGYTACCGAIRDSDQRSALAAIRAPTLVIAGSRDPATPPEEGRALAAGIAGARYVELPAAHLSNLEAPGPFTSELVRFLTG